MVFSGTNTRYLAEKICQSLGCNLGQLVITKFSDGEFAVSYEESIRGRDIFLVQSTFPNSDNLMELLLMIDAAKRASASPGIILRRFDNQTSFSRSGGKVPCRSVFCISVNNFENRLRFFGASL